MPDPILLVPSLFNRKVCAGAVLAVSRWAATFETRVATPNDAPTPSAIPTTTITKPIPKKAGTFKNFFIPYSCNRFIFGSLGIPAVKPSQKCSLFEDSEGRG
jgi:hypothetical protein